MVDALEVPVGADGPVDRAGADAQHLLQFLHQGERILARAVHLVDESEDRDAPHAADLEQLDGLGLHAARRVQEHHGAVGRDQDAVGVLAEILVTGGIQDVDVVALVAELHGAGRDGDAALLFDLHPVAGGVGRRLAGLDGPGLADGSAVEQQLFGQRCLAGVGVADDGKGAPALHLFFQIA